MELREGTAHAKAVAVSPPGRNGGWALGLVGGDLEALAIASANIVAKAATVRRERGQGPG
jgi:hypothetical protein